MSLNSTHAPIGDTDIAIVGMAARLPGAHSIEAYWRNLRDGISSIRRLSDQELIDAGESRGLIRHKDYVACAAPLEGFKEFDAEFFGFSPKEAAVMDPQHRQFLETAWEALETAGHIPENFDGQVGVFAGCGMGSYFYFNVCSNPDLLENTGMFLLRHTGNDKDFMTTRLSHVLDLQGPSINLQTACSTSLVATHYAVQSLLNGECDMALAGGVTIELPHNRGYLYKENEILSPDGACHAFDHRAQGTVFGSGAGVVVLRRLADAVADGDHIWSVIKGSAVNNDGSAKAGYLAPSVTGQAEAIAEAQAVAGVSAETIDYVECHGTGTYLGDPIEVAALTQAFRETTTQRDYCRIGSVKTNIGHLDTAAGVASLIKTSLGLHHRQIPPSLGYEQPNPAIDFKASPFRVNSGLTDWVSHKGPRRAGVNSLGVGGTNAHVVLEEAPMRDASEDSDWPFHILTISGRSKAAVDDNAQALAEHLRAHPEQPLADVAWTLQKGRRAFEKRRVIVAETHEDAARLLENTNPRRVHSHTALADPDIVFMFPGGGAQYAGMARDLYETEPVFADWMDRGLAILQRKIDYDIRALWLPERSHKRQADQRLKRPSVQLPLLMITEYALAQLWMSWGIEPAALTGHSMGENTAACVAGVISFEDCIGLVHLRGQLFDTVAEGGMLSVNLPAEQLQEYLGKDLDLGAVNAPDLSVATGPQTALDRLAAELKANAIDAQRIPIDIAAHSRMLDSILDPFRTYLQSIQLRAPSIPLTSNRTGHMMTDAQATDPEYWVEHLRGTVFFAEGIKTLAQDNRIFLEVGPGKALSSLARQHRSVNGQAVLSSLRHPDETIEDDRFFLEVLGRLWALGATFDWDQIWGDARRHRVPLPTYAFQHAAYFIDPGQAQTEAADQYLSRIDDITDWGWKPVWRPKAAEIEAELADADPRTWLMFLDDVGLGEACAENLRQAGHTVIGVAPGDSFARVAQHAYVLAPERGREGYDHLLRDLQDRGMVPDRIVHFWMVTDDTGHRPGSSFFHRLQEQGFYSLLFLAQAMADEELPRPVHITAMTNGAVRLRDEDLAHPAKSTIAGPMRVIPRELPGVSCATLDVRLPDRETKRFWGGATAQAAQARAMEALTAAVLEDIIAEPSNSIAALREGRRYAQTIKPVALAATTAPVAKAGNTYLITGGFGGIGLSIARHFAAHGTNLVLLSRGTMPDRAGWDTYLRRHTPQDATSRRIQAIRQIEAEGGKVMTVAADVCNLDQMRTAVESAKTRFGRIDGVIHAAGVVNDAPIMAKTPASVEDTFTPKIHGTKVLDQLFPDGETDWIVLFSSSSTVTAPAGQIDYVAANEYLNAFAQSRMGGKTKVHALNWGIWNEVGMAAEAIARRAGTQPAAPLTPVEQPMLQHATFDQSGNRVFTTSFSESDWVINEHRTRDGTALLPGTGYLTLAAQALQAQGEPQSFELRDLNFLRPLNVPTGSTRNLRIRLTREDQGYGFDVLANTELDERKGYTLTAQGSLALIPFGRPAALDLDAIRARCASLQTGGGGKLTTGQEVHLTFGPRWRVLDKRALGHGEGLADLSLPKAAAEDENWLLHPALLDIATGWAMELIDGYQPSHLWAPVSYARVRVHGPLPGQIVSWVRNGARNSADQQTAQFDITLCTPDGTVLLEVEGFTIRKLHSLAVLASTPRLSAAEVEFDDKADIHPLSPAEERLHYNLTQGILPNEGSEAFGRVLALDLPQVIVSSMDLPALTRQAAEAAITQSQGHKFDRPQLDRDYVAPENEIEATLAGFWEDLLGVQNVGVEDSFFDLGGHSLIAVRLFAKIKKAFRVDFPISVLFEAPTIRTCANLIAERTGWQAGTTRQGAPSTPQRRFKHLVAMHEGEGGTRTPFFLVAGMFGNVLNLRHLAHLLGANRPFYGLQARGLYGDELPHTTIHEAAADYISEIKQVQPEGPYLLGGFSGGGITAYEIARQLEAMGDTVAMVALLDTPLPQRRPLSRKDRLLIQLQEIRRKGVTYPVTWLKNRLAWEIAKRRKPLRETGNTTQFHNAEIEAAFLGAVAQYNVRPWQGRLHLFRPPQVGHWVVSAGQKVDSQRAYLFDDNDWGQHVPGVQVHEVPGDHDSMVLEPNVRVLAGAMHTAIRDAEAAAQGKDGQILPFPIEAAE
ncbi:MAG: SDR family NAD(P)-dependent oxidoreductase [Rhodobacteraceae bacterium]|nr:SDR family NAD(P)-dependent oxidoreductase [Paracoccaceae bacterium]